MKRKTHVRFSLGSAVALCMLAPACLGNSPGSAGGGANITHNLSGAQPGIVTLHRLNKAEYNNTVRDLLNTLQTPADQLPAESSAFGFDNIANALTISDASVRIYQQAAESLAAEVSDPNSAEYTRLVTCDPNSVGTTSCLQEVAATFAYYAWRRPVTQADVDGVVNAAQIAGQPFSAQLANVVAYTLMAPDFLFRIELDANPNAVATHAISDHELASRLSYFLWSSMPDDALFAAADANTLHDDATLLAQTRRMLADPKAIAFTQNFAGQWLQLRALAAATPSPVTYPTFDETLRASMLGESQRYFSDFLTSDEPITQLFSARYTYLNDRLAAHYNLPAPGSSTLTRVTLPSGGVRGGILTQGAWLTTQAHPDRSGVVARGKFVLGELLCAAPPAPPPNIAPLSDAAGFAGTQRQHLDQHVSSPSCAACHTVMDPIGYAFEGFDGIGAQRTMDNGFAVDTTGVFMTKTFAGAQDLTQQVSTDARFAPCFVANLFTYALGRAPTATDKAALAEMVQTWQAKGSSLPVLIDLIVSSNAFRMRGGAPVAAE